MKYLIIAEKPQLRDAIADAIDGSRSGKDPVYIGDYVITNVYGHILTLKQPEDYDANLKKWSMNQLPIYFDDWGQKVSDSAKEKAKQIKELLKEADCVIHAGDPDDEGQFLIDEVIRYFNYKGPVYRLDTNNISAQGLKKALNNLTDNKEHEQIGYAAFARSIADLTVGVNMSRYFTLLNNSGTLSVGRVQTPTLGLVVNRDYLIENHIKTYYYTVHGNLKIDESDIPFNVSISKEDERLEDGKLIHKDDAIDIQKQIQNKTFSDIKVSKKKEKEEPPLPFNLTKLQTYCGNKFGYDPSEVLEITQELRDKYKCISYNRSDCQYLHMDDHKEAPNVLTTVCSNIGFKPAELDSSICSKAFNDELTTAHTAIIPTDVKVDLTKMTQRQKDVYLAICKYYLAQFLPPAEKLKTQLKKQVDDTLTLTSTSTEIIKQGYRAIFKESEQEEISSLSNLKEGTYTGDTDECRIQERETKPPSRYTKTSLNEDMTQISKYVDDTEIKQLLLAKDEGKEGEKGSIGTPATRSTIIDGLVKRGFIREEGKKIISTELGREFYNMLPNSLKKADMTAKWWVMQEQIKNGEIGFKTLPESVLETCKNIMGETHEKLSVTVQNSTNKSLGKCPRCGGDIVEGKVGYGCSNWKKGCKFVIWKNAKGGMLQKMTITPKIAKELLGGNAIRTNQLYSPNKDKKFTGSFKLHDKGSEYGAEFDLILNNKTSKRKKTGWKL